MNGNGAPCRPSLGAARGGDAGEKQWLPEVVGHLRIALVRYVHDLRREGMAVPREVEELASFLTVLARVRQEPPRSAEVLGTAHPAPVPDRLLVTKSEAAERLGVSVRTVERLVATGRLRQVQIERLARFRVSDLEAYVRGLTPHSEVPTDFGNPDDRSGGAAPD
jgi:excisionase family DNA binding protein